MKVGLEVGMKVVDPTCLSPVSMQDERVLSDLRKLFFIFIKKQLKTDVFTNGGRSYASSCRGSPSACRGNASADRSTASACGGYAV